MSKRASGPPRRPRNPVAKAVRTPQFRMRVVPDKRLRTGRELPRPEEEAERRDEKAEEDQAEKDGEGGT